MPSRRAVLRAAGLAAAGAVALPATARAQASPPTPGTAGPPCAPRYLGSRAADRAQPYARFMAEHTDPPQPNVPAALAAGPTAPFRAPARETLPAVLANPGYEELETGYGIAPGGQLWVACLTDMPRVRPEMWDWWFGWHSVESARYRLWHPDAHTYAALQEDRTTDPTLTDRQRYRGNVSYVDEYIGQHLDQLAIAFADPAELGIDEATVEGTLICGTVGSSLVPVDIGQLFHQVRPTPTGAEMRSRFYLNLPGLRSWYLPASRCAVERGISLPRSIVFGPGFGADLLRHCGQEMNHLARFLPELYAMRDEL